MPLFLFATAERHLARLVVGSALLLGGVACSSSAKEEKEAVPANVVARNDFETMEGWGVSSPSLTSAKARSGRYSVKVDREAEFSIGYRNNLLRVSDTKINKLHLRGWALLSGPRAKAVVVVQITDPTKGDAQVYWQALDIRKEVKTLNHWTQLDKDFDLPATINSNQELRVYMWRTGPDDTTYLDDLEITKG